MDGNAGDYYEDESLERIVVKSNDLQELRAGELATITYPLTTMQYHLIIVN